MEDSVSDSGGVHPSFRDAATVARALKVDPARGLTAAEAARRLASDGPNELRATPPIPVWRKIIRQFNDPLVYLLMVAVAISVLAWLAEGASGWPVDATVIAAIVVIDAVLGFVQESRADNAVAALASITAAASTVVRDGELRTIPSATLVRGDVLVLAEGDNVGADARLIEESALRVAEASLTGESEPVDKDPAALAQASPLGDRLNMVHMGTAVSQGSGRAVVTETGMATEMGAIATMLDATVESATPLQKEIARVGRSLAWTVVAIAVVVMVTIIAVNTISTAADLVMVLLLGVSLAVAAVPEGLPAILTVILSIGVQRLVLRNAVLKRLTSVETLGSTSVICTDKTGTLTKNAMTIERIATAAGDVDVTGAGYTPKGEILHGGRLVVDPALRDSVQLVLVAGSLANNARLAEAGGEWTIRGDPTEASFLVAARKLAGTADRVDRFVRLGEVPFTSERKMMSVLVRDTRDRSLVLVSKGAPDVLLGRCSRLQLGETVVDLDGERRRRALDDIERLSAEAFRTIGVAYRAVAGNPAIVDESLEHDLVYAGVVGIIDPPRDEAAEAIRLARRAGVRVIMITGDHPTTAARIASDLGISEPGTPAISGPQLDQLDERGVRDAVRTTSVFARVAPSHKLRIVHALRADGHVVAMTGDGINDAPALKSADIGVAMGIAGTEVTKDAADMILADDNFATIVAAIRQGRLIFDNIRKALRYLLSSNMGEVLTVFLGVVFAGVLGLAGSHDGELVLPLLATQILWINLVTDSGPALALGVDPEVDDVMTRRPRGPHDGAIDIREWTGIVGTGLVMAVVTLTTIDLFLPGGLIAGSDSLRVARTAGFTTLIFAQLFNVFNARSRSSSAFLRPFGNRWLWGAIAITVALQWAVVEIPLLHAAFGTASMDAAHWAVCVAMASLVLLIEELRKLVVRALGRT
jgi:Ca2+-transporting ATPase